MPVIESRVNPRSAEFQDNARAMRALTDDLRAQIARTALGGSEAARARHLARGKLLPRERVERLLDPGTPFLELSPWPPTTSTTMPRPVRASSPASGA
ncbi:hypothetical protein CCAE64S_01418 [Castellaniella caeni]